MIPTWILDEFGITNISPTDSLPIYINEREEIVEIIDPERFVESYRMYVSGIHLHGKSSKEELMWEHFLIIFNDDGILNNPYGKYEDYMLSDKYFYYIMSFNDAMLESLIPQTKEMSSSLNKIGMKVEYLKSNGDLLEMFDEMNCTGEEDILKYVDFSLVAFREENDIELPF